MNNIARLIEYMTYLKISQTLLQFDFDYKQWHIQPDDCYLYDEIQFLISILNAYAAIKIWKCLHNMPLG